MRLLLADGAYVAAVNNEGMTPLQYASHRRFRGAAIATLLAAGASVNHANTEADSALCLAVTRGRVDDINVLLQHGVDVNGTTHERGDTALHIAPSAGFLDVVQVLLTSGVDSDAINNRGETPLVVAFDNDHSDIVAALQSAGVESVNA